MQQTGVLLQGSEIFFPRLSNVDLALAAKRLLAVAYASSFCSDFLQARFNSYLLWYYPI